MQTFFRYSINLLYLGVIFFVVISLSFSAFIRKEQLAAQYQTTVISGQVIKEEIPVLSDISGSIHSSEITIGKHVVIGDTLFKVTSRTPQEDSPQTHSVVAQTTGVIEKILVNPGSLVSIDTPLAIILSDNNIKMSVGLTDKEYRQIATQKQIYFYSPRLDQSFAVSPSILDPVEQEDDMNNHTITAIYTFVNPEQTASLLQHESLQLVAPPPQQNIIALPSLKLSFLKI